MKVALALEYRAVLGAGEGGGEGSEVLAATAMTPGVAAGCASGGAG